MTMNTTPNHLDDEILSALLDGDEGDSDVAAHLRACDRCSGRQRELAAARAALAGAPVEPVDELTRRRLMATALAAAPAMGRTRWASRHPALIGSAAAVVLAVLVGIPFVVGNDGKSGDADTTLAAPGASGATQESATAYLGDLGDLSDRESLRLRLTSGQPSDTFAYAPMEPGASPAAGAPSAAPVASPTPVAGGLAASTTTVPGSGSRSSSRPSGGSGSAEKAASSPAADAATSNAGAQQASDEAASRDRAETDACVAALLNGPAKGGRLTASGTGSFENRPAIVAVFDLAGGRVAFVADRSGCGVLDRFSV